MTLYKWSQTASADATADSTINWSEGQAPSSINDSARAMMAATAKYRDDIAGAIVTTGTNTSYAISSYQGFDTFAHLNGQMIAFTPHATNVQTVTLNIDSLGAKPMRTAPGIELQPGIIIQGTPYTAVYNNSDGAFYLHGFFGNPYNIPLSAGLDYWALTTPNSCFAFPIGQAISRTTYANLFSLVGTNFGTGDGSTTFSLPDKRGKVSAAVDPTGTIITAATMSPNGNTLGATGGAQQSILAVSNLPPYTPSGTIGFSGNFVLVASQFGYQSGGSSLQVAQPAGAINNQGSFNTPISASGSFSGAAQGGANTPFSNMPPVILCNYIMRII